MTTVQHATSWACALSVSSDNSLATRCVQALLQQGAGIKGLAVQFDKYVTVPQ